MIEFIKPTDEFIKVMAEDMRESDKIEVFASHGHTPVEALRFSLKESQHATMAVGDGIPFSMFGVAVSNVVTGLGHPWLLSSNHMFNYKDYFLENAPVVIRDMVSVCPRLVNYVHHANELSIKWLKSLGFTIENPEPYGVKGDLFRKFHMGVM